MNKRLATMFFIAFLIACVAAVTIAVIIRSDYPDGGLLKSCAPHLNFVTYKGDDCHDLCWDLRTPIRVKGESREIPEVIDFWNKAAGFELFKRVDTPLFDVYVSEEPFSQSFFLQEGGTTQHGLNPDGCVSFAEVHIFRVYDPDVRRIVLVHEFGHVIGLAHDLADPRSVMGLPASTELRESDRKYAASWKDR